MLLSSVRPLPLKSLLATKLAKVAKQP